MTTANTFDDSAIFTRVDMFGSIASLSSKFAASIAGFFSMSSSSRLAPGSVVAALIGTTAPLSAMSGPVIVTSLLSTGAAAPSAFRPDSQPQR